MDDDHETAHAVASTASMIAARIEYLIEGVMQESFQIGHRTTDGDDMPEDAQRLENIESLLGSVRDMFELDQLSMLRQRHG